MVKFCLQCKSAFWGGQFCPICPGEIELLDGVDPKDYEAFLRVMRKLRANVKHL